MSIAEAFRRVKELAEQRATVVLKEATKDLYSEYLLPRSPVYFGWYASNFHFTEGSPSSELSNPEAAGNRGANRTGVISAATSQALSQIASFPMAPRQNYYITNTVSYAAEIEAHGSPRGFAQGLIAGSALVWEGIVRKAAQRVL